MGKLKIEGKEVVVEITADSFLKPVDVTSFGILVIHHRNLRPVRGESLYL